jgi:hypothetical protein
MVVKRDLLSFQLHKQFHFYSIFEDPGHFGKGLGYKKTPSKNRRDHLYGWVSKYRK